MKKKVCLAMSLLMLAGAVPPRQLRFLLPVHRAVVNRGQKGAQRQHCIAILDVNCRIQRNPEFQ